MILRQRGTCCESIEESPSRVSSGRPRSWQKLRGASEKSPVRALIKPGERTRAGPLGEGVTAVASTRRGAPGWTERSTDAVFHVKHRCGAREPLHPRERAGAPLVRTSRSAVLRSAVRAGRRGRSRCAACGPSARRDPCPVFHVKPWPTAPPPVPVRLRVRGFPWTAQRRRDRQRGAKSRSS